MKDTELRGLILQKYYDRRREGYFQWSSDDFKDSTGFDATDLFRVCDQLGEHGLIDWKPLHGQGGTIGGAGRISAFGVDVIEEGTQPPISITFDHSHNVTVTGSSNVQVGNSNIQGITVQIESLIRAIDASTSSDTHKTEAKSLLKKFLEHPVVAAIVGGLASSIKP